MRRSLFQTAELRLQFLNVLVNGVIHILNNRHCFDDPDTYHMFCQLLGKMKVLSIEAYIYIYRPTFNFQKSSKRTPTLNSFISLLNSPLSLLPTGKIIVIALATC